MIITFIGILKSLISWHKYRAGVLARICISLVRYFTMLISLYFFKRHFNYNDVSYKIDSRIPMNVSHHIALKPLLFQ